MRKDQLPLIIVIVFLSFALGRGTWVILTAPEVVDPLPDKPSPSYITQSTHQAADEETQYGKQGVQWSPGKAELIE